MANICDIFFQHKQHISDLVTEFYNRLSLILFSVIQAITLFN